MPCHAMPFRDDLMVWQFYEVLLVADAEYFVVLVLLSKSL